ncbi:16S rRNA (cytosine967-C5)-methyltransferase [Rhizobium sp. PP-F2F-G48]|uniref:RsmB/NOP family class I SAM-dependent RNA methyltransferase n=1 Tax=Rhizobium sp. PP-F2F-G48 TaxID=2135651 RepID=UPI001045912E|nr:RsmB/NOP family class I SAM-dependent RNA methyltransferase [Rhizobium sp. PP-F2F-G48]TCM54881.1 16S rRNA (cytosine967-C5)-methyltransferase [Rhizobium sp. PP-F2F-G48]
MTKTKNDSATQRSSRPAPGPEKPGLIARQAAAKLLGAVLEKKISLDGMLDPIGGNPAYRQLSDIDRTLVKAILHTALRHLPRIEFMLDQLLKTPLPDGARALHHQLVVAATQIVYLDIPDHSAVDLAVEQANADPRNRRFASLTNAVLRRLSREKDDLLRIASETTPSLPKWYMDRLVSTYGREEARRIADVLLEPAAIDITVKSDPEGWAKRLGGLVLPTGSVRLASFQGAVSSLDGFDEGEWWVQDAAASLPAKLFGDIAGQRVVDLCAAPGGKTAQLIGAGAQVTALDQSASRLKRLNGNLERLGLSAETLECNMADFRPETLFDAALLDAPCSSTGTIRRHPDVPYTKGPDDITKLAGLQERLLRHALTLVKPGGIVVFSNCSLDPAEGETMVARVVASGGCERVPVEPGAFPGFENAVTSLGELRTTPAMLAAQDGFSGGLDGFYATVLRRSL